MIHAIISLIFCLIIGLIQYYTALPIALLCFLPAAFYLGREITQAEYRYIKEYCGGKRENMPWWAPFSPKAWNKKSILDWVLPTVVSTVSYLILFFIF